MDIDTLNIDGEQVSTTRVLELYEDLRNSLDAPDATLDITPFQASDTSPDGIRYAHNLARRMCADALYRAGIYPLEKYGMGLFNDVQLSTEEIDTVFETLYHQ